MPISTVLSPASGDLTQPEKDFIRQLLGTTFKSNYDD